MAKSVFALRLVDLRSVRLNIRTQNPKSKCSFRSSKSLYLEKKKRFKESYKTSVNFEDLNVDYVLQHFNLCLMKAMKKLNRNLIEEDSSLCSENFIAVHS